MSGSWDRVEAGIRNGLGRVFPAAVLLVKLDRVEDWNRRRRELAERYRNKLGNKIELSMGMTGDFEVAIEEGSTMVRIGTAIFGGR